MIKKTCNENKLTERSIQKIVCLLMIYKDIFLIFNKN